MGDEKRASPDVLFREVEDDEEYRLESLRPDGEWALDYEMGAYLFNGEVGAEEIGEEDARRIVSKIATHEFVEPFICQYCGLHRYHLPGEHDQCDHSVTGECVEEEPQGERSAMFKTEREIVKNKRAESGAFYDSSGAFLGSLKGGRDKITINERTVATMKSNGNATFTHNHPSGGSLSLGDLESASRMNLKEMRVVGENKFGKFTFIVKRPSAGWPTDVDISKAYSKYQRDVAYVIAARYKEGRISKTTGTTAFAHAMAKLTAREIGAEYKMIRIRKK